MNFTTCPDLRTITDADLEAMLGTDADADTIVALVAEMDRRERAARKAARERARRAAIRAEWELYQHAQYLAADAVCRGNLLSKAGLKAGVSEQSLWTGRATTARKYASEELNEFWDANPRLTVTEYARQRAAEARIARREYREEVARVKALNVAARKVTRNIARRARETAKAQRAAARTARRTARN